MNQERVLQNLSGENSFRLCWTQSNIKFCPPYFLEVLVTSFFIKHRVLVECYKTEEQYTV